jgi:hypothetical protein
MTPWALLRVLLGHGIRLVLRSVVWVLQKVGLLDEELM